MFVEPVWALRNPTVTVVVSQTATGSAALPSGLPVALKDINGPLRGDRGLFLVGYKACYEGPIGLVAQQGCRAVAVKCGVERSFAKLAVVCWKTKVPVQGLSSMGLTSLEVPKPELLRSVRARAGPANTVASQHVAAAGLSLYLANHASTLGLVAGDFSVATCDALGLSPSTGGCYEDVRAELLEHLLRSAFQAQVPVIVVSAELAAQSSADVRVCIGTFVVQTGYFWREVKLDSAAGGMPQCSRWWVVLSAPAFGPVSLPGLPEGQPRAAGLQDADGAVDRLQCMWIFGLVCDRARTVGLLHWAPRDSQWFDGLLAAVPPRGMGPGMLNGAPALITPNEEKTEEVHPCDGELLACGVVASVAPGAGRVQDSAKCAHAFDSQPLAQSLESETGHGVKRKADDEAIGPVLVWHRLVTAEASMALHEITAAIGCDWFQPGQAPQPGMTVLLSGVELGGHLVHACDWVIAGHSLFVVACGPLPADATQGWPEVLLGKDTGCMQGTVPNSVRLEALGWQAHWLADDQMQFLMEYVVGDLSRPVSVLDPLLASAAVCHEDAAYLRPVACEAQGGGEVVTALWVQGHWVTFHWCARGGLLYAWSSLPMCERSGPVADAVAVLHCMYARVAGLTCACFRFQGGPVRAQVPGFCGHYAIADLVASLHNGPAVSSAKAVAFVGLGLHRFGSLLEQSEQVRFPVLIGGVLPSFLEAGLVALLKSRGVPENVVQDRAQAVLQRLGAGKVQGAMQSEQQWKELKALCSNCTPPLQLVLPSELKGMIEAKAASGEPLGPRRKNEGRKVAQPDPPRPVVPLPSQMSIPDGEFEADGQPLRQLGLGDIGPNATGVVPVSPGEAAPYLQLARAVSCKALGLLVFGPLDLSAARVKHAPVRFQAVCPATSGPMLLSATLLQIGDRFVQKRAPAKVATLDLAPSSIVRVAVYRDEWLEPWTMMAQKPIRAILELCPKLRTCYQVGCTCDCWHGVSAPGVPEALLEVWGRGYMSDSMRAVAPDTF